jgi:riboflavin synthase
LFTGLVEEAGTVSGIVVEGQTAKLSISAPLVSDGAMIGDSIAINGCCLTVTAMAGETLSFEAVPETMARTNLGRLTAGDRVNLERPLQVGARLGGHFVQGHIDGVGVVHSVTPEQNAVVIEVEVPEPLRRYIVEKGSIAVDGVSLTVANMGSASFTVWIIPHTRTVTNLGDLHPGDRVNLECDLIARHIERLIQEAGR